MLYEYQPRISDQEKNTKRTNITGERDVKKRRNPKNEARFSFFPSQTLYSSINSRESLLDLFFIRRMFCLMQEKRNLDRSREM
jgi:hypothetical protein